MDGTGEHCAKWNKSESKQYCIFSIFPHVWNPDLKNYLIFYLSLKVNLSSQLILSEWRFTKKKGEQVYSRQTYFYAPFN
jgi:hypothetical protein